MAFFKQKSAKKDKNSVNLNKSETDSNLNETQLNDESASEDEVLEERGFNDAEDYREEVTLEDLEEQLVTQFTQIDPISLNLLERGKKTKEDFSEEVKAYIAKELTSDEEKAKQLFDNFAAFIWSYDVLDELIEDDDISDIKCYDWDHIRIKRLGKREATHVKFRSPSHYTKFVEHIAIKNKVSISDQNAAQKFTDKENSEKAILRFNITTGFINSSGKPVVHIRKVPKKKKTEEELIELGFFGEKGKETADYIKRRIVEGGGFLVAGKGGSGKTTLLNWMIDLVPEDASGIVIQQIEELFSKTHPDMDFKHTVHSRGEGKIAYDLSDLSTNALLTDEDYFIIGEIKGDEAIYLVNAVYTGAKGWASVHGASAKEAFDKLIHYILTSPDGKKFSREEILKMLIHLDTIIFMEDYGVREIAEVIGYNEKKKDLDYKQIV